MHITVMDFSVVHTEYHIKVAPTKKINNSLIIIKIKWVTRLLGSS